jgi:ParB family transcriptional regulator, chromosome partitioning protein
MKSKGLGRNFDSLIPTQVLDEAFDPTATQDEQTSELRKIAIIDIVANDDQPRRHFDELALEELTESIREHGILQPIVVTPQKGGKYQIVAGERRWRAAKGAGLTKVPAIIRTLSNQHKLELALIENLQRKDLNAMETATAYLKLHEQFNLTLEQIGKRVGGKAVSTISNTLRLLQLPDVARQALVGGKITEGHARQILAIDNKSVQKELLEHIIREDWSVRKAEQYVTGYKQGKHQKRKAAIAKTQTETPQTKALGERLSTEVKIRPTAQGGQLLIRFKDDKELERLTKQLLG